MLEGLKRVAIAVVLTAIAGGVFGVLLGALTGDYLLWTGIMVVLGANFGLVMGYGFLPES
jgi:hypothetical protein